MTSNSAAKTGAKGPRRSLHFIPGANQRLLEKGLQLPADALVLDLEDSVAPGQKEHAREVVSGWLRDYDFGPRERLVRVNPLDSPWGHDDLQALVPLAPDGLLLPKIAKRAEVEAVDRLVSNLERQRSQVESPLSLLLIAAESPASVFGLHDVVSSPRVDGLSWGVEDLGVALGMALRRSETGALLPVLEQVRGLCRLAAASAGVQAIDCVYADHDDIEGLRRECETAAVMGFSGKLTIHPKQIEIVNAAFTPSMDELRDARELLAAFAAHQAEGSVVFSHQGRMVDTPHLAQARRLLRLAEQLGLD